MTVFWVQVTEPGHPSRVIPVADKLDVGRDCDGLRLDDPTVSRRHLILEPTDNALVCVDLASANGTYVDGARLDQPVALRAGQVVRLGETELVVHEGHEVDADEGRGSDEVVIEVLERPSEAVRDLARAASKTDRGRRQPPLSG